MIVNTIQFISNLIHNMDKAYLNLFKQLQSDPTYLSIQNQYVKEKFEKIKEDIIKEFDNHPVTVEISGGISSENISRTLSGITNLYSFIGFEEGDDPIQPIRELLLKSSFRIMPSTSIGMSKLAFEIPTAKDIFAVTPMPWAEGRSWAKGIETGISGLGFYLKKTKNSRSGLGVQSSTEQVRKGVSFKNTKYISDLINRFELRLKNLD